LVEYDGRPVLKLSSGKKTWVGKKQLFRFYDEDGLMREDLLGLDGEDHPGGEPLLAVVIGDGSLVSPAEPLDAIRSRFAKERETLPLRYRDLAPGERYPVGFSSVLQDLEERTVKEKVRQELAAGADCE
jgi:nicotinate phosphoribosyltransferase